MNKTKTVKSSNLPKIIAEQSVHLARTGKDEKLPDGPILSPNPGPTLLIAVAAPDIDVSKSKPRMLKIPAVQQKLICI